MSVVREMHGLRVHHRADAVKIVCAGTFSRDAARFAEGKSIELIGGEELMRMIGEVRATPPPVEKPAHEDIATSAAPASASSRACPRCGKSMVERSNRKTGQKFLGCSAFPACRGVR